MLKEIILNTKRYANMQSQIEKFKNSKQPTYIFGGLGAMSLGSVIADYFTDNHIPFEGFLANKAFITTNTHKEKPVLAIEENNIDKNSNIIIGFSKWTIAKEELHRFGYTNIFLFDCFSEKVLESITLDFFLENYDRFYSTYSLLEDKLSQQSMSAYLQAKIFNNFIGLSETYFAHEQTMGGGAYFNNLLSFGESEIMVDCGAFNGDTAIMFAQKYPNYKKIYAYEPDPIMFNSLTKNTHDLKITLFNKGVFSKKCTLSLDIQSNGCSSFDHRGQTQVEVEAIDNLLSIETNPITFIKMDIEGSELEALKGSSAIIQKDKPKLAICVYHKANDLFAIPEFIKSLRSDYKFYLRNHQMIPEDTVLYAY